MYMINVKPHSCLMLVTRSHSLIFSGLKALDRSHNQAYILNQISQTPYGINLKRGTAICLPIVSVAIKEVA
jgi:hypothetical protein